MYQRHEESLKIMEKMFREKEGVIALVFGGSVAKGIRVFSVPSTLWISGSGGLIRGR